MADSESDAKFNADRIYRADGRIEWSCKHGVGHTISVPTKHHEDETWWTHGCDGCCREHALDAITGTENRWNNETDKDEGDLEAKALVVALRNSQWTQSFKLLLDDVFHLHMAKRNDYTGSGHPLENYRRSAETAGISVDLLMLSRIQEKVTRASHVLRADATAVKEETAEDTLIDIANIALLIVNKRRTEKHEQS